MFGTLRPNLCHLPAEQGASYRRMYCGTCQSLGEHYGHLTRPLLSFDIVLLASIVEALQEQPGTADSCRCPLLPVVHRPTIAPDGPSMRIAAAVQVVLTQQWLADHAQDGSTVGKIGQPLLRKRADKARRDLQALGLELTAFDGLATRQLAIERNTRALSDAAEPTAAVLESLFGQIGKLPGATATATARAQELAALGRRLGTAIYVLDALEDLAEDVADGQFNPCIDDTGRISTTALDRVVAALDSALADIRALVTAIPWHRHRDIIDNILGNRLPARCRKAIAAARELAILQPAPRGFWARSPLTLPIRLPARALFGFLTMVASLWTVFVRHARMAVRRHERATTCDLGEAPTRACPVTPALAAAGNRGGVRHFARVDGDGDDDDGHAHGGGQGAPPAPVNQSPGGGLQLDPSVIAAAGSSQQGQNPGDSDSSTPMGPDLSQPPPEQSVHGRRRKKRRKKKNNNEESDAENCCELLCCGWDCYDCACCCITTDSTCGDGDGCCCDCGDCGDCCDCADCCDCSI